jgi:hypothetical protein
MSTTISKPKAKRLPKGQRTHVRRMKQEANSTAIIKKPVSK